MSFFDKNKNRITLATVTIILMIMIGTTGSKRMSLSKVEIFTGNMLTPVGKWTSYIAENVNNFFINIKSIPSVRKDNDKLREEIIKLEKENKKYEDIIGRKDFLSRENEILKTTDFNLLKSQITGKEPGNWFDRFTIDKGSKDGVKKGDTVVQAVEIDGGIVVEAIVGRVADVSPNWSKIVTVVDELSRLSFKIIRTQDGGILSGGLDSEVTGYLFDNKADIIKGDKIMTSGIGGVYKEDIYVGEVSKVTSDDNQLMKEILVKPAIDFKKIYDVYIILNDDQSIEDEEEFYNDEGSHNEEGLENDEG